MATYADWAASRQSTTTGNGTSSTSQASGPVKILIDGQGNLVQDVSGTPSSSAGIMQEEADMSLDDQQEIVHNIRQQHRDSGGSSAHNGNGHHYAATQNEEQRMWSNMAIPPATILLVIGTPLAATRNSYVKLI